MTNKTLHGILVLIDIVNYTAQANRLDDNYIAKYTSYFESKIREIAQRHKYQVIKSMGDALLLFGTGVEELPELMLDLFDRDKPVDRFGFQSQFRMVAHSGFFQFKMARGEPVDLVSADGIKVFRLEKHALAWQLVVTHELYKGIKALLPAKNIKAKPFKLEHPLKGFDGEDWKPPFYRLTVTPGQKSDIDLLNRKQKELKKNVQTIPVFGNIYKPVNMKDNFINLSMVCQDRECIPKKLLHELGEEEKSTPGEWRDRAKRKEWPHHDHHDHHDREHDTERLRRFLDDIDVPRFYRFFYHGVILGLPGAGKTTILRHLAYREFQENKRLEHAESQLVIFAPCRDMMLYDKWYRERLGHEPGTPGVMEALDFMTWVFLFDSLGPQDVGPAELVAFQEAARRVNEAWKKGRVTLLIDALDEAGDERSRERIKELFMILHNGRGNNRVYLTSRPSEGTHLFEDMGRHGVPEFRVLSLTMEQVRGVARSVMKEKSAIYKKFDEAVWQEEMVTRMAATPITALLVAAYFQAYERFDHRYPMYDLLMKFILLKVWEHIKTGEFPYKNMKLFFQEIKRPDFLDRNPEAAILYNALASLCFRLFYHDVEGRVLRAVSEADLKSHLTRYIREYRLSQESKQVETKASQWQERFHRDHLLLQAGAGRYVFVHSTMMEYLAAYYMIQEWQTARNRLDTHVRLCMEKEAYLSLETLPIAAGSSLETGFRVLARVRELRNSMEYGTGRVNRMGLNCLAEVEWLLTKELEDLRIIDHRQPILDKVEENKESVSWVYEYTCGLLLETDEKRLETFVETFQRQFRLSRETLLADYLSQNAYYDGGSAIMQWRNQLLKRLVRDETVVQWLKENETEPPSKLEEEEISLLRLDSPTYNPQDKNFAYFQIIIGPELIGFYGSPNFRHEGAIQGCAITPNGRYVVSASSDFTLKLWALNSGKELRSFKGHKGHVNSCVIVPDGKRIISASDDQTLKLWRIKSGYEIRSFIGHKGFVNGCAMVPGKNRMVSASDDRTLKLWNITTGKEISSFIGHKSSVRACAVAPNGQYMISASDDRTLKQWDLENGKEIRSFEGHKDSVRACAVTQDGRQLVSASDDHTLKLWDLENGKECGSFKGHRGLVLSCALAPDGRCMVSSSSAQTLKLWDLENGKEIRTFKGHKKWVKSCAVTPDGQSIVSASSDQALKLWDLENGKEIHTFRGHKGWVRCCMITLDGRHMISASGDYTLKLWDLESGKEIRIFKGHKGKVMSSVLVSGAREMVSASEDRSLKLWNIKSGREIRSFQGHKFAVNSCSIMPDGDTLISASEDHSLKLWDIRSGREIRSFLGHKDSVYSCAVLPDGHTIVSASGDHTLKLWDIKSGKEVRSYIGHQETVWNCVVAEDGHTMVSSSEDHTLKLWDIKSGREIRSFMGHQDSVYSCSIAPEGRGMVSVSDDRTLKLWDLESGALIRSLNLPWRPLHVIFHPTIPGRVFSANGNGTLTSFQFKIKN